MENIKLETGAGDHFSKVAERAQYMAKNVQKKEKTVVEFDFNGVKCMVDRDTNLDWLYRDYCNAHIMTWKQVGTDCVEEYDPEIQAELDRLRAEQEKRQQEQAAIWKAEKEAKQKAFDESVKGIKMKIRDRKGYNEWKANQKDDHGYGNAIFEYAENWARLMQKEFQDRNIEKPDMTIMIAHAEKCSHDANTDGITGFMYGAAVAILANHWKYGELLRKWHNKEYGHEGDGVVNPAVLTIGK